METHVYEYTGEPNKGLIIVHPGVRGQFGDIVPGSIWCWSHATWENIPDSWYAREGELRAEITEEWRHIRRGNRSAFTSPPLAGWVRKYCAHRGWRVPDMGDRHDVFRFIRNVEDSKPVR